MKENTDLRAIPQTRSEPKYGPNTICAYASCGHPRRMHFAGGCSKNFCQCAGFWERAESAAPEPKTESRLEDFLMKGPMGDLIDKVNQRLQVLIVAVSGNKAAEEEISNIAKLMRKFYRAEVASKPREDSSPRQPLRHTCREAETDLDEQYCAACENLPLHEWVRERYENCIRLAGTKSGLDRDGWLNDADYFRRIEAELRDSPSRPSPEPAKSARELELETLLNTPEIEDFDKAVPLEAAHQQLRWGAQHDAGKNPEDWFWLVGYLAGKALAAQKAGNLDKAKHHCISTSAALRNWHAHIRSGLSNMRPGIAEEKQLGEHSEPAK